jgi:hypothetical protein
MKGRTYREKGGKVEEGVVVDEVTPNDVYAGEDSNVLKEAKDRSGKFKKGGKVSAFGRGKMSEGMDKFEAMKAKKAKKEGGSCEGMDSKPRLDRAKRASGGPLSTASKVTNRPGGKMEAIDN